MPLSDEMLMQFMKETIATTTATGEAVKDLRERIFPNGQPSAFQQLYKIGEDHHNTAIQMVTAHTAQDVIDFKEVNCAVAKVDQKVTWYSGAIAACGAIGTLILGLLTWHAAEVAAKAAVIANTIHTH